MESWPRYQLHYFCETCATYLCCNNSSSTVASLKAEKRSSNRICWCWWVQWWHGYCKRVRSKLTRSYKTVKWERFRRTWSPPSNKHQSLIVLRQHWLRHNTVREWWLCIPWTVTARAGACTIQLNFASSYFLYFPIPISIPWFLTRDHCWLPLSGVKEALPNKFSWRCDELSLLNVFLSFVSSNCNVCWLLW